MGLTGALVGSGAAVVASGMIFSGEFVGGFIGAGDGLLVGSVCGRSGCNCCGGVVGMGVGAFEIVGRSSSSCSDPP